jgi:predicted transport protein
MAPQSPEEMTAAVTASMKERTGRTLEEWLAVVGESGVDPLDQKAVRAWLKTVHGVPQNTQWAIAFAAAEEAGWVRPDVEGYVESQYSGAKSGLRPIFDRLREVALALGDDVAVEGRGGYIPFVRRRQFAAVAAATRTRVDLGLRYVDAPTSSLLNPSKSGPGQSTHKVALTSVDDVTADLERLLAAAYDQNG